MSSLAASRADNFYFPPEFDPAQGSLNAQRGTHALGKRAKHIDKGIITVRCAPLHSLACTPTLADCATVAMSSAACGQQHHTAMRRVALKYLYAPALRSWLRIRTRPASG